MIGQVGTHEKAPEEKLNTSPATRTTFPFLRLPAEIRNDIYRLVLLTQNVTTFTPKASQSQRILDDEADGVASVQLGEVAVGAIRCECSQAYETGYQPSILRASWQIYHEASSIFHLENFWTVVRINKLGFGAEMKNRGFPVVDVGDLWGHIRFPVMKIRFIFPSLDRNQSDTFAVATIYLEQLMRALWTAKGASEMGVMIQVQPSQTNNSPTELMLLRPFLKLRGIQGVMILGVSQQEYVDELTSAITTGDGLVQAFDELRAGLGCLQQYVEEHQWGRAYAQAERHSIFLNDCKLVYGMRFVGLELGISINRAISRSRAAKEITISTAVGVVQISLFLGQYAKTVRFTSRAMEFIFSASINPTVVVPVTHPLHYAPDTVRFENEATCFLILIRARAYIGMRKATRAMFEIAKARELDPNSLALATVTQDWDNTFGPSAPPLFRQRY
ncbi:hypothetical protein MMC07_000714 [Pseudocyphellaria aurata]|nr:hypothetical protein [Pseudocyphellaria aurata]